MNDDQRTLVSTVRQIIAKLEGRSASGDRFDTEAWSAFEELGLTLISVPEENGGSGGSIRDALALVKTLSESTIRLPVAETSLLGGMLLSSAGLTVPPGPLSAASLPDACFSHREEDGGVTISGTIPAVPWASACNHLAIVGRTDVPFVALLSTVDCTVRGGKNIAGEPRGDVVMDGVKISPRWTSWEGKPPDLMTRGALVRAVQMTGAMKIALIRCAEYTTQREQFGRPISAFQIVRQMIAKAAEEYASAEASVAIATQGLDSASEAVKIAIAKTRTGEAGSKVAETAHQVLGAIGFTEEHDLHHYTKGLWSWRDDFGNETYWADYLARVLIADKRSLWEQLIDILDERSITEGEG